MMLRPRHGQNLSILQSNGIARSRTLSCRRENLVRFSTFPLSHHPGTETRLKSKICSTVKPMDLSSHANFSRVYLSRCCRTWSNEPYNDGCCGTRIIAFPPGCKADHKFLKALSGS